MHQARISPGPAARPLGPSLTQTGLHPLSDPRQLPGARRPRASLRAAACALLALLAPLPAAAQMAQAGPSLGIFQSRQEQLERAVEEARWNLGPIRVQPWIGVRDVAYQTTRNADGEEESDLRATAGAGLRLYLPMGTSTFLAAHALPEYVWWQDADERRQAVGRYGVGLFAFLNRLELELSGRRVEDEDFATSEVLARVPQTTDTLAASAQLRLAGSVALFASASLVDTSFDPIEDDPTTPDVPFAQLLDRETTTVRGGARYLLRGELGHVGVGVQQEETDFATLGEADRSNDGTSAYAELFLRGNKVDVALDYVQRELEAVDGSTFTTYEEPSGSFAVALRPGWRASFHLYGSRRLGYSLDADVPYIEEDRTGLGSIVKLGDRSNLQLFYELGDNRYAGAEGEAGTTEDVTAWGALFNVRIGRYLGLNLGQRVTRFEPSGGGETREIDELVAGVSLSFGDTGGDW